MTPTAAPSPDAPGQSLQLLLVVARHLENMSLPYLVVGAVAATVHGVVRATLDADALVSIPLPLLAELGERFSADGYRTELRVGDDTDPIPAMLVITDSFANRVDLLGGLRGLDPAAFTRAISVDFRNTTLRLAGIEDLVAMKCFAGRPQDLVDARAVLEFADAPPDLDLLRRLTRRFGRGAADNLETLMSAEAD